MGPVPQLACLHSRLLTKHLVHHEMKNTPRKLRTADQLKYSIRPECDNKTQQLLSSAPAPLQSAVKGRLDAAQRGTWPCHNFFET